MWGGGLLFIWVQVHTEPLDPKLQEGHCKLSNMGVRKWTQVLYKNNTCSTYWIIPLVLSNLKIFLKIAYPPQITAYYEAYYEEDSWAPDLKGSHWLASFQTPFVPRCDSFFPLRKWLSLAWNLMTSPWWLHLVYSSKGLLWPHRAGGRGKQKGIRHYGKKNPWDCFLMEIARIRLHSDQLKHPLGLKVDMPMTIAQQGPATPTLNLRKLWGRLGVVQSRQELVDFPCHQGSGNKNPGEAQRGRGASSVVVWLPKVCDQTFVEAEY